MCVWGVCLVMITASFYGDETIIKHESNLRVHEAETDRTEKRNRKYSGCSC